MIKKQIENFIKQCNDYCEYANELTHDICVDLYLTMLQYNYNYKYDDNIKNVKIYLYYDIDVKLIDDDNYDNLYVVYEFVHENYSNRIIKLIDCENEICYVCNDNIDNDVFSHLYFKMIEKHTNAKILHINNIIGIFKNFDYLSNDEYKNNEIIDFVKNKNKNKIFEITMQIFNMYFNCDYNFYNIYLKMYVENKNVFLQKKCEIYEYVILLFICYCNKNNIIINNEMKKKLCRVMCDETKYAYEKCNAIINNLINKNFNINDFYNYIKK